MRILIISDSVYPFNKGGKEKRIFELISRLRDRGHHVVVFTMKWWEGSEKKRLIHGVEYFAISKKIPLYSKKNVRSLWQAFYFSLSLFDPILKHKNEYDIIDVDQIPYAQLFVVKIALMFAKKSFVCTWHEVFGKTYWKTYLGPLLGTIISVVEKYSARMPRHIIAVSEHTKNDLIQKLSIKDSKISVIENGIDFQQIQEIVPHTRHFDIICAGRLLGHKNIDFLLEAISAYNEKYHSSLSVGIIGDGPEREQLEKRAQELHLHNVFFLGFLEQHHDVYAYMKSSRVFAFPSEREGFGIVVLEAYACGLPVIGLNVSKNHSRELIEEGKTGYLVKKDVSAYVDALHQALSKGKEYFSKNLEEKTTQYSWDVEVARLEEVYTQISSSRA